MFLSILYPSKIVLLFDLQFFYLIIAGALLKSGIIKSAFWCVSFV